MIIVKIKKPIGMKMNIDCLGKRFTSNFNFSQFLLGFILIIDFVNGVGKYSYVAWSIRVLVIRHITTI